MKMYYCDWCTIQAGGTDGTKEEKGELRHAKDAMETQNESDTPNGKEEKATWQNVD